MPASLPGAPACAPLEPPATAGGEDRYRPNDTPDCMRVKMNGGAMDRFALGSADGACGDRRDFACAGAGADAGPVAVYHRRAAEGAVADRFFQTFAFVDAAVSPAAASAPTEPTPYQQNFLYFESARFTANLTGLFGAPLLTEQLSLQHVPWAIYAGRKNLAAMATFGVARFYDPHWSPFRSLEGAELEHDIASGQLPSVSVVVPDVDDPLRSESPRAPLGPGIALVDRLVGTIAASPYAASTLVLVVHLTAGGYYDHVRPPAPPALDVDASSGVAASGHAVAYGPRVPLLALGRFARRNHVSHVPLELSSVTVFAQWNWLRGARLKGAREPDDPRRYRDTVANNLGSLLDARETGVAVPGAAP
jgi:hypothetical protein